MAGFYFKLPESRIQIHDKKLKKSLLIVAHSTSRAGIELKTVARMPVSAPRAGRSLSPLLRKQLDNLDKDAESRKSAMKVLKSFVEDLDSKSIPFFLAEVSQENGGPNLTSRECAISLYEVLARFHGRKIVPQIDSIMSTIVKTLKSSAGSFPLQLACSKVVPAIARYGIESSTPEHEKPKIIYSLCKPLSDMLMSPPDSAASGSALCLKALAESENWRFASNEIVDELCLRIAGALQDSTTQTNCHMGLAMTLAVRNDMVIEAYARSIILSGMEMLTGGSKDANLHKRLTAIQMIKSLMKNVDSRSYFTELERIIGVLHSCECDPKECVRGAANEALLVAKSVRAQISDGKVNFVTCSNTKQSNSSRKCASHKVVASPRISGNASPGHESPESHFVDSYLEQESVVDSPLSSSNFEFHGSSRRRLWRNEKGGVDISLKDGLISEVGSSSSLCLKYADVQHSDDEKESPMIFSGFDQMNITNTKSRSTTPSPRKLHSEPTTGNVGFVATPRKLIDFLQDQDESSCESSDKQAVYQNTPKSSEIGSNQIKESSTTKPNAKREKCRSMFVDNLKFGGESNLKESFKSVSSEQCISNERDNSGLSLHVVSKDNDELQNLKGYETVMMTGGVRFLICFFLLAAIAIAMLELQADNLERNFYTVPT